MLPRVAVIIVTHNGRQFLPDCLSSLRQTDYPAERWTLMVVDNASGDGSAEYVREHFPAGHAVALSRNTGFAAANNIGLRYAIDHRFDYAYLLNQDTAATPAFLRAAVAVAEAHADAAAVQSKLLLHGTALVNSWGNEIHFLGFGYAGGYKQPDGPVAVRELAYASGAAVLLRCAVLRQTGLLDESLFMYHEDLELGWRLWLAGYRCLLAPASVVYHKYEFFRSLQKYYWMERNRFLVMLTHYRLRTLLLLWPASLLADAGLLLQSVRGGYFRQVLAAHSYFFLPQAWRRIVSQRRLVRQLRRRPDRAVVERFSSQIKFQGLPETVMTRVGNAVMARYWQLVQPWIRW